MPSPTRCRWIAGWGLLLGTWVAAAEPPSSPEIARAANGAAISFARDIRPLLAKNCFACHGPDDAHRQAGLRLDLESGSHAALGSGFRAIVPGDVEASELVARITSADESEKMPPLDSGRALTAAQIDLLRRWVAEGGRYEPHWAFLPPRKAELPAVRQADWPLAPWDRFVLAGLEQAGLSPAPQADRRTYIRRVSLDLRGLPPSPDEVRAYLNDASDDADAKMVDRMLDDPAFGERWARVWLDLARYADSAGYGSDPLRLNMWRYRDWVIDAFNRNLPYDQFVIDQLAGDLLPNPTAAQRMATAFHRNTMTNTEGGTDDEEFRTAAVKDRTDTTLQVFMGLTMGCAKCHNHKYDPITQKEYYQFYAILNQTADADRGDEAPLMDAPSEQHLAELAAWEASVAALRRELDTVTPERAAAQEEWEKTLRPAAAWTPVQPARVAARAGRDGSPTSAAVGEDGWITASAEPLERGEWEIVFETSGAAVTGLRLETEPSANGASFIIRRIRLESELAGAPPAAARGRYVRIELPGNSRILSLAEVEVLHGDNNLARQGKATQSSTGFEGAASRAIDGETNGRYYEKNSVTHTNEEADPWWEVDLGQTAEITALRIWNRTDPGTEPRIRDAVVKLFDADRQPVWQASVTAELMKSHTGENAARPFAFATSTRQTARLAAPWSNSASADSRLDLLFEGEPMPGKGWIPTPTEPPGKEAAFVAAVVSAPARFERTRWLATVVHEAAPGGRPLKKFRLSVATEPRLRHRADVPREILALVDRPAAARSEAEQDKIHAYYASVAPELKPIRNKLAALEKARPVFPKLPILQELPFNERRKTFVMNKGNFLAPGEEVQPAVLESILPLATDSAADAPAVDRLAMARWIVDRRNPLTARVAVNRFWAQLFGIGLVETEEDFGVQGELPSHPELLDWLAVEFMENGWDVKRLLKQIVLSRTYRQSSTVPAEVRARDPRNRWLGRAPRFRLEAEIVRDQALALSGLLSRKIGGPSVYPPQPPGLWQAAFNGERNYPTSQGEDRYRRGLYTVWRRTVPYPSMAALDAPSREICTVRRIRTNTPLQALVTLNDPCFVEAAQALGRALMTMPVEPADGNRTDSGDELRRRVEQGIERVVVREPHPGEVEAVVELYQSELAHYRAHPDDARALATEPLGPLPEGADPAAAAAWTVVANVLLNLDGVLTRN